MSGCINKVSQALPPGPNVNFALAAGSGLYGGHTDNANKKVATMVTLAMSFAPEMYMMATGADMKQVSTSAGLKCVGYGLGFVVGKIFK
jgi:hypothetical protein